MSRGINLRSAKASTHKPTRAKFAPNPNSEGSLLIYTGSIGWRLANGELFSYAEVLAAMKTLWVK